MRAPRRGRGRGAGLALLLLLGFCAVPLAIRSRRAPEEHPAARAARGWADPVAAALEAYRRDAGRYPEALEALAPRHLAADRVAAPPFFHPAPDYHPSDSAGYELTVYVGGPRGPYACRYTPVAAAWRC